MPCDVHIPFDLRVGKFYEGDSFIDACDGEMGAWMENKLMDLTNIKILNWLNGGARMIYSSKPLETWDDLKGLKIRTPESNVYVSTFTVLGANPTPLR